MAVGTVQRPAVTASRPAVALRLSAAVGVGVDLLCDLTVLTFAAWTILYHLGLIFDIRTNPLLGLTALCAVVLLAVLIPRRLADPPVAAAAEEDQPGRRLPLWGAAAAIGPAGLGASFIAFGGSALWWPGWALAAAGAVATLVAVCWFGAAGTDRTGEAEPALGPTAAIGTWLALATAAGLGVFSMFVSKRSGDDAFYINRAAWVADHGTLPTQDTMFSDQTLPAIRGAGVPVASIEALQGAVGHALHVAGGSVAYLVTPPVVIFLAVWAMWRLVRRWAPRRHVLCFTVAIGFILWASAGPALVGSFFFPRIWQGKAVFLSLLVPLTYLYLTEWAGQPTRRGVLLLAGAGVAAVGLTSSGTFLAPLLCAGVAGPLLLRRHWWRALGALLPAAYPVLCGLVVHFSYTSVDPEGESHGAQSALHFVFGDSWFCLLGLAGVLGGAWVVRYGAARLVTAGIAAVLLLVLAPGALTLMAAVTGAQAVLWRTMWVAPTAVLVGVLASVPLPARARWLGPLPAVGLAVLVLVAGSPFWRSRYAVAITSAPQWRYSQDELNRAREILARHPRGPVLAPPETMRALDLLTTRVHAVSPRFSYVALLEEPQRQHDARILLRTLITGGLPKTPPDQIRAALDALQVGLVCGLPEWTHRKKLFHQAGFVHTAGIDGQWCLRRPQ